MKYWYCYIPAMLAMLPLLLSTIFDCIADSAKQRAARKNPPKQRPEIISADATPAPPAQADTPAAPKRGRGRPRKYPPADPAAPAHASAAPAAPTPAADTPALLLPKLDPIVYTPDEFAALIS